MFSNNKIIVERRQKASKWSHAGPSTAARLELNPGLVEATAQSQLPSAANTRVNTEIAGWPHCDLFPAFWP